MSKSGLNRKKQSWKQNKNESFRSITHCLTPVSSRHNVKQNVAGSFTKANSRGVETTP